MPAQYFIANCPMPTTAAPTAVTTGTSIKTMLQVKLGSQNKAKIIAWGISFDGSAAATPIKCELLETGSVFATVTASAAADISKYGDPNDVDPTTSNILIGTTATGYTATSEGSITATRTFDLQLIAPTGGYAVQFPLSREPHVDVGKSLRIRVTAPAAVNCYCWVVIEI